MPALSGQAEKTPCRKKEKVTGRREKKDTRCYWISLRKRQDAEPDCTQWRTRWRDSGPVVRRPKKLWLLCLYMTLQASWHILTCVINIFLHASTLRSICYIRHRSLFYEAVWTGTQVPKCWYSLVAAPITHAALCLFNTSIIPREFLFLHFTVYGGSKFISNVSTCTQIWMTSPLGRFCSSS